MFKYNEPDDSNDVKTALTMLHSTVMHSGSELRETLTSELQAIRASNESLQTSATKAVADELSRMRGDLRDTRNSVVNSRGELGHAVRNDLADLRQEVRQLTEAVQSRQDRPAEPTTSSGSVSSAAQEAASAAHTPTRGSTVTALPTATAGSTTTQQPVVPHPRESTDQGGNQCCARALGDAPTSEREDRPVSLHDELKAAHMEFTALRAQVEQHQRAAETSRTQLTALGEEIAALRDHLRAALPLPATAADEAGKAYDREAHRGLLRKAAQVSCARLICHRDSWEFVTGQAGRHPHFRMPSQIADHGADRIAAAVSGRSLIAILISLQQVRHLADDNEADWALADTVYERISTGLTALAPSGDTVTITLDDRAPAADIAPTAPTDDTEDHGPDAPDTNGTGDSEE